MYSNNYTIHKFGGACLANKQKLELAVHAIQKEKENYTNNNIIVVSASLGVTDIIRSALKMLFIDQSIIEKSLDDLDERHGQFIKLFPHLEPIHKKLRVILEDSLNKAFVEQNLSPELRDICLVTGEKFMIHTMVAFLNKAGLQAMTLTPEEIGLISDGHFFKAQIDFSTDFTFLREKIAEAVKNDQIIVIPGFYGIFNSKITTFGPSGTDYSATALGNILNAEKILIWKDVDGFMTCDPRLVNARTIDNLGYSEAAELAHFGAKVLHPRAVLPAQIKEIPIEIRNINNEIKSVIVPDHLTNSDAVKSLSFMKDVGLLKVYISSGGHQYNVLNTIYATFSENKINIFAIATSSTAMTFLLNQSDLEFISSLLPKQHPFIEKIEIILDICLICVVGKGLGSTPNTASEIFNVVGNSGINIEMITAGASPVALQFTVKQNKLDECLSHLHNHFFSQKAEKIVEFV